VPLIPDFHRNESLRAHTPLCIVISSRREFSFFRCSDDTEASTKSGKLIGMLQTSRYTAGSLCMSSKAGHHELVSQE
jgi:hypothetical protein